MLVFAYLVFECVNLLSMSFLIFKVSVVVNNSLMDLVEWASLLFDIVVLTFRRVIIGSACLFVVGRVDYLTECIAIYIC